jgi:hypothetical protein
VNKLPIPQVGVHAPKGLGVGVLFCRWIVLMASVSFFVLRLFFFFLLWKRSSVQIGQEKFPNLTYFIKQVV